jgi:hypothetical protein
MPPKEEAKKTTTEAPVFVFERDRALKKFNEENFVARSKIIENAVKVPVKPHRDPAEKLKDRLATYHNTKKMRTDYKNYVRLYGEPSFEVPEYIKN